MLEQAWWSSGILGTIYLLLNSLWHTMILPHLSYCATSWSHISITTLKFIFINLKILYTNLQHLVFLKLRLKYGLRKIKYVIIDLNFLFYGVWCDIVCVVCIVLFVTEYCNFVTTSCPGTADAVQEWGESRVKHWGWRLCCSMCEAGQKRCRCCRSVMIITVSHWTLHYELMLTILTSVCHILSAGEEEEEERWWRGDVTLMLLCAAHSVMCVCVRVCVCVTHLAACYIAVRRHAHTNTHTG